MEISVSYLVSNYSQEKTIMKIEGTSAEFIHVDLMDGGFVPNKNFTIEEILNLLKNHEKPLDVHLMTFDPIIYIDDLASLNPEYITFHIEATKDIVKTIELIKNYNIKVGLAIKPNTDILELMPYLSLIDLVLIMSVEPGMGGQSFLPSSVDRLETLVKLRRDNNLNFKLEMDGGLNEDTIKLVQNLDIAVSGSYICKSDNYEERIEALRI
ncbi:MAG: ribulose-phosphate 3-epimerase [Ruminococcus sp.]|nr:ribulose-phosphate 3-epimerase [Ruminococcus sp.]